ncbi:exonuclease 3'-5' domain-containing protein 2 isoform X2 [Schistocerca gregaria]|uniref:exonuclease 3'-5' domain-containing protein 2 isoform X2 n=1 Tax=Schistocerca gregaria TaxID=7010 RepID=UPI00211E8A35|nr:exonuclease 3'-5' domain-containing protein 2 isoform X2 [Schistocerca gregaria]
MTDRNKYLISGIVCATVGVSVIFAFRRLRYRRLKTNILHSQQWKKKIIVVDSLERCAPVIDSIKEKCQTIKVLGFDCEWVTSEKRSHPVALLQLASSDGFCALFRLCKIKCVPDDLKVILEDSRILKVGVAPTDDAKYLFRDYGVSVRGCLDLRHLLAAKGLTISGGLAGLAENILGVHLNKDWKIRCSDWERDHLTQEQCEYAALDALAAYEIFIDIARPSGWFQSGPDADNVSKITESCQRYLDIKYKSRKHGTAVEKDAGVNGAFCAVKEVKKFKQSSRAHYTRSRPLYDNCYLQAPDGEILCTCDNSKAKWYIQNNLGDLITEDPFTVRLRFEPSGRAVGEVGSYYTQVKDNCCVVCGRTESYLRKNIIPREYRKYFPAVMKDHTSHDVLLLCWECHQLSNWHDLSLRTTLAKKCDAPIGTKENLKTYNIPGLKEVRSAAVALLRNGDKIPPARKEEIKKKILNYFQERGENNVELTPEMLEEASVVETCVLNQDYQPHGQKVVEFFKQDGMGGLVQLERMWREHFLETMQPKYLPPLWSVSHNHHRLAQRAEQNRVLPHELDIAGLGHITIKDSQKRCEDPSG